MPHPRRKAGVVWWEGCVVIELAPAALTAGTLPGTEDGVDVNDSCAMDDTWHHVADLSRYQSSSPTRIHDGALGLGDTEYVR